MRLRNGALVTGRTNGKENMEKEELVKILDEVQAFSIKGLDYKATAIITLRTRIPYDVIREIVQGAGRDVIYLCGVEEALPYLTKEDAHILAVCNVFIDTDFDECFALFT
jgi:hypothetical protein